MSLLAGTFVLVLNSGRKFLDLYALFEIHSWTRILKFEAGRPLPSSSQSSFLLLLSPFIYHNASTFLTEGNSPYNLWIPLMCNYFIVSQSLEGKPSWSNPFLSRNSKLLSSWYHVFSPKFSWSSFFKSCMAGLLRHLHPPQILLLLFDLHKLL